ncbi:8-oxo-dGTP pyrophosphatase MutT (NUDIX family) [Friedmanniella endophytica]|uniref:8-oxo-dGTP pyrophosphatase MutT (NUDIX family) n=1 Tax=Microlunatus kandeliicorticis TaxID=1759536 RepID=A0A7W3IQC9_9ACTN|nr:NUDIX hydrolase [Microlunatus kandeliicorticis]MBA8793311.1 8-oxo-dGTP pyrophosphatase MutT (NUDIX family) [Microlunatus kandeliicorticis]
MGSCAHGAAGPAGERLLGRQEFLATLPRRRLAAGALVRDEQGRFCLVEPTYKPRWILPGGTVETGESPREACAREIVEELGVALPVGRLLVLDPVAPDPPVDPHGALILAYDGGVWDGATIARFRLPGDELRSFRFVDVDEATGLLDAVNHRRVVAALDALRTGTVAELG